jgi:orotate phosphoribosyltransferase
MDILATLKDLGGLLQGHFVLKSGRHSDQYLNKDVIYPHVDIMKQIGEAVADLACDHNVCKFTIVVGPEKGGIILAQWVAHAMRTCSKAPLAIYAEKTGADTFGFKRGYDQLLKNQKVLLVEDILTTGGSIIAVNDAIQQAGGEVVGTVALINRGNVQLPNLYALTTMDATSWIPEECPLCQNNTPFNTNVGHGKK